MHKYISEIEEDQLESVVEKLIAIRYKQATENEYKCSSALQVALQDFFFHHKKRKCVACFPQYPVKGTRLTDFSIYTLKDFFPWREIAHADYKPFDLLRAIKQTICYFVNSNEDLKTFSWAFGLPSTCTEMNFQLYISANNQTLTIDLARVEINGSEEFKRFLTIVYAAIHWRINHLENPSSEPLFCEPIQGLVLRDNFPSHPSVRVFYNKSKQTVYKIYKDEDTKVHNYELMKAMGYFKELKLQDIGKKHHLLSYKVLQGHMEPMSIKQIDAAEEVIKSVHSHNMVHSDIRRGNIVFGPGHQAFLIDFDFAAPPDSSYHEEYNKDLAERHPGIHEGQTKQFDHDFHSLNFIRKAYFPKL